MTVSDRERKSEWERERKNRFDKEVDDREKLMMNKEV